MTWQGDAIGVNVSTTTITLEGVHLGALAVGLGFSGICSCCEREREGFVMNVLFWDCAYLYFSGCPSHVR